jgi:hypothetical protein
MASFNIAWVANHPFLKQGLPDSQYSDSFFCRLAGLGPLFQRDSVFCDPKSNTFAIMWR